MNFRTTTSALVARLRSPRTLLAIVVSVLVTAGIGGPLAFEAYHARDLLAAQRAGAETNDDEASRAGGESTTSSSPTSSTPTSSAVTPPTTGSTTIPGASGTVSEPSRPPTTLPRGGTGGGGTGAGRTTVAPTTIAGGGVTTTTAVNDVVILVSVSAQLVPFAPLAGKQVTGVVYVFVDALPEVAVQWRIDGSPIQLAGALLDTTALPPGAHTLEATVLAPIGVLTGTAPFTVAR